MKFVPPIDLPKMPEVNFDDWPEVDRQKVEKYTAKYHEMSIKTVPVEESVMGKIKNELENQTEVMRNYASQQEENRKLDEAKTAEDASKRFRRDATIAIASAIVSSVATHICENYGGAIVGYFISLFQK